MASIDRRPGKVNPAAGPWCCTCGTELPDYFAAVKHQEQRGLGCRGIVAKSWASGRRHLERTAIDR